MGIFGTVNQRDYETLRTITYDVEDVFPTVAKNLPDDAEVVIRLREYELYERLFVFRGTTQKQCIDISVCTQKYVPMRGESPTTLVNHTVAWKKENGPSSGWDFQIRAALDRVKQQLREKYGCVEPFEKSVETVVSCD